MALIHPVLCRGSLLHTSRRSKRRAFRRRPRSWAQESSIIWEFLDNSSMTNTTTLPDVLASEYHLTSETLSIWKGDATAKCTRAPLLSQVRLDHCIFEFISLFGGSSIPLPFSGYIRLFASYIFWSAIPVPSGSKAFLVATRCVDSVSPRYHSGSDPLPLIRERGKVQHSSAGFGLRFQIEIVLALLSGIDGNFFVREYCDPHDSIISSSLSGSSHGAATLPYCLLST